MSEENSIHNNVEEKLKEAQEILQDDIIEYIRRLFQQFNQIPETFDDYQKIVDHEKVLCNALSHIINEMLMADNTQNQNNNEVDEDREKLFRPLKSLQLLASKAAYSKKVDFVQHVLNSPNKKEILFSNILLTSEEDIKKRYKKLSAYFHPDRNMLKDKHKNLACELFLITQELKDRLLDELGSNLKGESLVFHEKKANELWRITIDYRNAAKSQWNSLKVLKKEDLWSFSSEELKRFSINHGRLAYREYKVACKIADNAKLLKKQVKLRGYIALCLYVSNNYLEAQLFSLSSLQLLIRNSQKVMMQDLIEAKKIFDKVKGGDATGETIKLSTEIKLENDSDDAEALVKVDREISNYDRKNIMTSIDTDMALVVSELMLKVDRYHVADEKTLHTEKHETFYKAVGGATMVGGALFGLGGLIAEVLMPGPLVFITAPIGILFGLFNGYKVFKQGSSLFKEPEIREKLNEIMTNALNAYDKGDHQGFIDELSKKYKEETSLLRLKENRGNIVPKDIIDDLLSHGFRPDGIAYLLNLLGEILTSKKVKIKRKTTKELGGLAKDVFNGALNKKLVENAKILDERIQDLQNGNAIKIMFNKIIDTCFFNEYSSIAKEFKDDDKSQKTPFRSRLEEMRNIARINLAIFDILDTGPEEIERAVEIIKKIEDSINKNYQFVSMIEPRVEALRDLLWVINGEISEEAPKIFLTTFSESIKDEEGDKYHHILHDLNKRLNNAFEQEKLLIYINIAAVYEKLAEKEDNTNRIKSLSYWKNAQDNYENAREINNQDLDASLGLVKCLLKLSKYTQVIGLSKTNPFLTSSAAYWRFLSTAHCKQAKYSEANDCIMAASKLDHEIIFADKQWLFLQKISKENNIQNRINNYKMDLIFGSKNSSDNKIPVYNILSIDGGGIRGVLPALWLSEIEHRTHRASSLLFNMIAGTSTGGIIAAGLSAPKQSSYSNYSTFKPKFLASDLLDLYQNKSNCLFTTDFPSIMKMMYSDKGRLSLFEKYFSSIRLKQTLTELVIPAAREVIPKVTQPHLFTRYDAFSDDSMNETLVDTLMATTAIPTYFSPYKLGEKGLFLDGGIHLNNPVEFAYFEAIRYGISREKISILSLGTGDYIPDPSNPYQCKDQLFWKKDFHMAQQDNIDYKMYTTLGSRYQRWQVYLENPIKLNDYGSIPYLLEIGHQYIEELDASDENPINKIVESFDDFY